MTMGASQVCGFLKSDPSRATPNLQFHVQPISTDILGATKMHDFDGITPTIANVRPTSRGEINISSSDSRDNPKNKMNYLSTQEDRDVAAKGLKIVRKIMLETEVFKKYEPEEYRPGVHITDDEELVQAGSEHTQTIFHPVGTCKMGIGDDSVVNEKLKVRGLQNLRVIDASIMPNITSGNTNAPTIMIAEKGSDFILKVKKMNEQIIILIQIILIDLVLAGDNAVVIGMVASQFEEDKRKKLSFGVLVLRLF